MRRREPLDPAVAAELEALDAALVGAPGADPELVLLAADARAVAPRPSASFRASLDRRVDRGFVDPRPAQPPRRSRGARRSARVPALAAGIAAAVLVALVLVLGARGGGGGADQGSRGGAGSVASREAPPGADSASSGSSGASGSTAPAPAPPLAPGPGPGRRVERTVRLELGARSDRFDRVTDDVVRTTQRAGGFVASSQVARTGTRGTASFVLRIPVGRLDAAVAALSRLAHVRGIEQATQDLTGALDGTAGRLRDARTQRRALVAAVATASGDEAARLRARLDRVTTRVQRLERELRALRGRTSYATIDLTVTAPRHATVTPRGGDRWTPAAAWRDARRALEVVAGVLIVTLAVAIPVGALGALAWLALGPVRRRRREGALDAP